MKSIRTIAAITTSTALAGATAAPVALAHRTGPAPDGASAMQSQRPRHDRRHVQAAPERERRLDGGRQLDGRLRGVAPVDSVAAAARAPAATGRHRVNARGGRRALCSARPSRTNPAMPMPRPP